MKRLTYILLPLFLIASCCSHREVVVNATAQFNAEDSWQLVAMRGKEVRYNKGQKKITIQVNPEAGTFSGISGCNRYFGNIKVGDAGQMTLSDFNATKMACPDAFLKMEGTYIQLLERCNNYVIGQYSLDLRQDDKVLLSFERIDK